MRPKHLASIALSLTCTLQTALASAHLPELYGREYRRVDPLAIVTPNRSIDARPAELPSEQEAEAARKLAEAESLGGAYDPGQADPLVNMAQLQLERGEGLEAEQSLRRAIHLIRINEGLYHPSQLPLLRNLMEMYREQGNYPALGDSVGYYYRVLNPGEDELSGEKLEQTLEYLRWERELFATRDDGDQREHILRAYRASEDLLARAEDDDDAEAYIALAMSQLRNLYLILGDEPLESMIDMGSPSENALSGIQRLGLRNGVKLLDSTLARAEATNSPRLPEIHRERGDWYQWNGQSRKANREYARVIELLNASKQQALVESWLGEAVELPDERDMWPLLSEDNRRQPVVVEARFSVNAYGDVRGVRTSTDREEDSWQASRVRKMLQDTHFRPRIGPAGPEPTPEVTRYYRLLGVR